MHECADMTLGQCFDCPTNQFELVVRIGHHTNEHT